jgi:hypothetical protein
MRYVRRRARPTIVKSQATRADTTLAEAEKLISQPGGDYAL